MNLIRDKEDLLEPMLEDPKLLERLFDDQETFMRISPHLLLLGLLRRVLLADRLSAEQRKAVGSTFVLVGLVTTIPAVWAISASASKIGSG